jgi:hypothetical protein
MSRAGGNEKAVVVEQHGRGPAVDVSYFLLNRPDRSDHQFSIV